MKSRTKTILFIVLGGAMIIGFITYNVIKLVNTFSDDEKTEQSSEISFSLTSEDSDKTGEKQATYPAKLTDKELLLSKQKPYVEGQQRLEVEQNPRNQPTVSFSSIFSQQGTQKGTDSKNADLRLLDDDQTLDLRLPSAENIKPDLTKKSQRRSAVDQAYEDLESDIQTFYKDNKSVQRGTVKILEKEAEPVAVPISDMERRRRALQDGFDIHPRGGPDQIANRNEIIVAIRGDQEVVGGQSVKLRVLDACRYNGIDIPRNTILDGRVSLSGSNRLSVYVNAMQVDQQTYSVELKAYDMYGQAGLPLTIDKGKSIGNEEISDAVENVARQTIGRSTLGKIVTGSFGELRREGKKTIKILDAQKLILK